MGRKNTAILGPWEKASGERREERKEERRLNGTTPVNFASGHWF